MNTGQSDILLPQATWEKTREKHGEKEKAVGGENAERHVWGALRPEKGWNVADIQSEDNEIVEAEASRRQRRGWAEQGRCRRGDYPEPSFVIAAKRRWVGSQGRGSEEKRNGGGGIRRKLTGGSENA